jgi:3-oxoacyl-[acyl-carrier-protein] synthase II
MNSRVLVTGAGMISAIGKTVSENLNSIRQRQSGIGRINYISTRHKDEIVVAEVKATNEELRKLAGISDNRIYSRTALLGVIAATEAIRNAGIIDIKEFRTGIISATSVGGIGIVEDNYLNYLDPAKTRKYYDYLETNEFGESTEKIADVLGIRDYLSTINTACSSSANAIMFGARLIKHGLLDRVLVGGTDAISRFTINGFQTLQILDSEICKPFDANRKGLNLGEGAGFLVLENEKAAKGKTAICMLAGYGNSNEAFHPTSSSPEGKGAFAAMQKAFRISGISPDKIDYINAHGTGTWQNDLSEGIAIEKLFEKGVPAISSTKAFTGHTLGASGGIEAVLSVLAIQHNLVYPNLNFTTPMPELSFRPNTQLLTDRTINHVLSNSFGFGGNNSALIFSRT